MKQLTRIAVLLLILGASVASPVIASSGGAPDKIDPALRTWPQWPYRISCGQMAFDPIAVFSGPAAAERGSFSSERALKRMLDRNFPFPLPHNNWRLAAQSKGKALFLHGRLGSGLESGTELSDFELRRHRGRWRMSSFSQLCEPLSVRRGHFATTWFLSDQQTPLDSTTRRVRIDVGAPCGNHEDLAAQAEPQFDEIGGSLVLTVFMRPSPPDPGTTCSSSHANGPPLVVDLPGPLGDRQLFDGGIFPPTPARKLPETNIVFG